MTGRRGTRRLSGFTRGSTSTWSKTPLVRHVVGEMIAESYLAREDAEMTEVSLAHTADLDMATLRAVRRLLNDVFDDMTDDDWEHALGGIHALVWDDLDLAGHASVVQRRLIHEGRALRTGYVEGVAVRADRRARGLGGAMMTSLERVIRQAYDLGALGATDEAAHFYSARDWRLWRGTTCALTPSGIRRTPDDDGAVYVLPVTIPLSLDGELICDWRDGDTW